MIPTVLTHPAPATDENGNDCWHLWAELNYRDEEIVITCGSYEDRSAMAHFLMDEGYTIWAD